METLNLSSITKLEQILESYEGLTALQNHLEQQLQKYTELQSSAVSDQDSDALNKMKEVVKGLISKLPGWRWALVRREIELRWASHEAEVDRYR